MLRPIPQPDKIGLCDLPAITFGAGTFSGQYGRPEDIDISKLIREAYDLGLRSFDTSPYYGDSEKLLGGGLRDLFASGVSRDELFIMTKCGRYGVWEFDYSPETVERSVRRSCRRLGVDHLDVVFLHDVEFVGAEQVLRAISALFALQAQGVVRHVGISGYPLHVLDFLAAEIAASQRSLDIILSYSHYNIQNTTLAPMVPKYKQSGIKAVISASPLSMGLLKESGPPEWHPASDTLKARVIDAVKSLEAQNSPFTMADVAVGFALGHAAGDNLGSTVIGFSNISELHMAVETYWEIMSATPAAREKRRAIETQVIKVLGASLNETWPSPPEIGRLVDPAPGFMDDGEHDA